MTALQNIHREPVLGYQPSDRFSSTPPAQAV